MHPDLVALRRLAAVQGGVVTRGQARSCGCTEPEIRRLLRSGAWTTVRRGVLAAADSVAEPPGRLVAEAAAVWLAIGRRPVLSHGSAAALHGLVLPAVPSVAEVTADRRVLTPRTGQGFRLHAAGLLPHQVTTVAGLPVTTVARTVLDLARRMPTEEALVLADDALHRGLLHRDELERALLDCATWPGARRAARVVAAADGRAESPLETICRLVFARHGLPPPDLQALIVDDRSAWFARVDFLWAAHRTVVEADGRLKYARPADLWQEKLRQERIEELGYAVLRVTWDQVTRAPAATVARVLRAFARGALLAGRSA